MPVELRETRLPGIGVKYGFRTAEGGRLAIVLHNDGVREIYFFRQEHADDPSAVIRLDDDEARQLGAVIGGAYERPKIVEELDHVRAEQIDYAVEKRLSLHGENALITAQHLAKVEGDQIHLG